MLRKLLKYDFAAVIKLWSIGAVAVLVLSVFGGFAQQILFSDRNLHGMIRLVAGLMWLGSILGQVVFVVLAYILVGMRYYKNFFTDEGYLTFTLPVKLHSLINSKLILVMVMLSLTGIVNSIGNLITGAISSVGYYEDFRFIFEELRYVLETLMEEAPMGWIVLYAVEVFVISFFGSLFSVLFLGCCITFGSIIAKRAKLVAAIGTYYVSNFVFSMVIFIFMIFGLPTFVFWLAPAVENGLNVEPVIALLLFGVLALLGLLCSLLYTLQYRLLDRKLNLP